MDEGRLIPFDWDLYCAGYEAYELFGGKFYKIHRDISKTISRSGDFYFGDDYEYGDSWPESSLRLLKPKQEDYDHFKGAPEWANYKVWDGCMWSWVEFMPAWNHGCNFWYVPSLDGIWREVIDTKAPPFTGDPKDSLIMRGDK